jgi:hypothetical protein
MLPPNRARDRRILRVWRDLFTFKSGAICIVGDICDLPSSPEGAIKIDEICCDQGVAVGKVVLALKQLGLCRGDIQEVGRSLRVTLPCGLQSGLIFRDGAGDVRAWKEVDDALTHYREAQRRRIG